MSEQARAEGSVELFAPMVRRPDVVIPSPLNLLDQARETEVNRADTVED